MKLVTPDFGLIIWMTATFLVFLFILKKFVWPPILKSLKDREDFIDRSLKSAEEAKAQLSELKADNEKLLAEAKIEREKLLKEAREMKEKIISDAKVSASEESNRMISAARMEIDKEKTQALSDIKKQVGEISLEIAEKLVRKELGGSDAQQALIDAHLNQAQSN